MRWREATALGILFFSIGFTGCLADKLQEVGAGVERYTMHIEVVETSGQILIISWQGKDPAMGARNWFQDYETAKAFIWYIFEQTQSEGYLCELRFRRQRSEYNEEREAFISELQRHKYARYIIAGPKSIQTKPE